MSRPDVNITSNMCYLGYNCFIVELLYTRSGKDGCIFNNKQSQWQKT